MDAAAVLFLGSSPPLTQLIAGGWNLVFKKTFLFFNVSGEVHSSALPDGYPRACSPAQRKGHG